MAGTGPAPSSSPRRRNARVGVVVLPAGGYTGPIPKWPMLPDVVTGAKRDLELRAVEALREELEEATDARTKAKLQRLIKEADRSATILDAQIKAQVKVETELWRQLWRTPQAKQWSKLGWVREVAQYARHKARAELGSLDDAKEARMLSDRLGLSPKAMRGLLWVVADDEVGEKREQRGAAKKAAAPRRRLAAVDDTGT